MRRALSLIALSVSLTGCIALGSNTPAVLITDGDTAVARSQYGFAITIYTRAIDSGRLTGLEAAEAYLKRGAAHSARSEVQGEDEGELFLALQDFAKARDFAPNLFAAVYGTANAYKALGAYAQALESYRLAYALDGPKHYWSLIGIADTYRHLGDYQTAMRYHDRALEISGPLSGMPIFYYRALTLFAARRYREAITSLDAGILQEREDPWAYVYRACSYARLGDYPKALTDYDSALGFIRRARLQFDEAAARFRVVRQIADERSIVTSLSKGGMAASQVSNLCEEFVDSGKKRTRSTLLPRVMGAERLPVLDILPGPAEGTPAI
jgi:tetratricopeptide (TPR) repeat protein